MTKIDGGWLNQGGGPSWPSYSEEELADRKAKRDAYRAELEARYERCGNCRFWQQNPVWAMQHDPNAPRTAGTISMAEWEAGKDEGWCRQWPAKLPCTSLDWCGQFEPRKRVFDTVEDGERK